MSPSEDERTAAGAPARRLLLTASLAVLVQGRPPRAAAECSLVPFRSPPCGAVEPFRRPEGEGPEEKALWDQCQVTLGQVVDDCDDILTLESNAATVDTTGARKADIKEIRDSLVQARKAASAWGFKPVESHITEIEAAYPPPPSPGAAGVGGAGGLGAFGKGASTLSQGAMALGDSDSAGAQPAGKPSPPPLQQLEGREQRLDKYAPGNDAGYASLGRQYGELGRPADAERAFDRALAVNPENGAARALRGAARVQTGDLQGAYEDSRRVLARDPGNETAKAVFEYAKQALSPPGGKPLAKPEFGALSPGGRVGAGGTVIGSALDGRTEAFTGGGVRALTKSQALALEAERMMKLGDLKGALEHLNSALAADPRNARAYALRASLFNKLGKPRAAILDASEALKLDPRSVQALNERAFAYNKLKDFEAGKKDAEAALAVDKSQAMAHFNRAVALESEGRTKEALEEYRAAAGLDPVWQEFYEEALDKYGAKPGLLTGVLGRGRSGAGFWLAGAVLLALVAGGGLSLIRKKREAGLLSAPAAHWAGATARQETPPTEPAPAPAAPTAGGPLVSETPTEPGSNGLVGGHYRLIREIGLGGMGVVYEGLDAALNRRVAVKKMREEIRRSAKDAGRFLTEARLVAALVHPNIAQIHAVVEEHGDIFLIFEYVDGRGLDKVLDQRPRLSLAETRKVLADVCRALEYAHSKKIIHRDLKPSNVMVTGDGSSKVMDFGIAHQAKLTVSKLTSAEAWGTPAYMPPEQEMGAVSRESDLYALAALAYEMLTGEVPFRGPNFLAQKQAGRFRAPSEAVAGLPKSLDAFFDEALQAEPARRFHSAPEFLKAFERA